MIDTAHSRVYEHSVRFASTAARSRGLLRGGVLSGFAAIFVGAVLGGIAASWVFPRDALADPSCGTYHRWELATQGTLHHGIQADSQGMWIYDQKPVCIHTSSVITADSNLNWAEVGWVDAKSGIPVAYCNASGGGQTTGDGAPKVFRFTSSNGGNSNGFSCTTFGDIPVVDRGHYKSFMTRDHNGTNTWSFWYDGTEKGATVNLPFTLGTPEANGERYTPSLAAYGSGGESADALFQGLQYWKTSGMTWANFSDPIGCGSSNDPIYRDLEVMVPTWIQVTTGGDLC